MTSGINGVCNRNCRLGAAHDIDCHNYIEIDLPCPVCSTGWGRHIEGCILGRG